MAKPNIKKGDTVIVIAGKDKGKTGKVVRVLGEDDKVVVERIALAKKHTKPRGMGEPGGIVEVEATIHLSNLKLIDPKNDQPTKVGFRVLEDGRKVRVARATGNVIES